VRARITGTVALLVAVSLAVAGVLVYVIERERLTDRAVAAAEQELDEFSRLEEGRDPDTGQPFDSVSAMLRLFLERNVPGDEELLIGWVVGGERLVPPGQAPLVDEPAFLDATRPLVSEGGSASLDLPSYGELLVVTQPVRVRGSDEAGALVVVIRVDDTRAGLDATMRTYAVVALIALLVATGVAFWLTGQLLAPLRRLRRTADGIGETDLSLRLPVTGNDDITALTRTVNSMLDRLEAAFAGQRRFLDDAGHELRTPLTVLRGHLELLDASNPEDVEETRALLTDEVDRMSRLVGDLILLAKSDRPDFLAPAPVRLDVLTDDLLAKAAALGEREWRVDARAGDEVVADAQRLTQAVLALCDNAVKHTRPGDVVAVGSAVRDGQVVLWVRDTGPGVREEDHERVFQRFGRSRLAPGDEGFGLGLSIVAAIAAAHGGAAGLVDPTAQGHPTGACFEVSVPVVRPDPASTRTDPLAPSAPSAPSDRTSTHTEEQPWPGS